MLDHWLCVDKWWAGSPEHTASAEPGSVLFSSARIQQPAGSSHGCTGTRPLCTSVSALTLSVCAKPAEPCVQKKTWWSQTIHRQHRNAFTVYLLIYSHTNLSYGFRSLEYSAQVTRTAFITSLWCFMYFIIHSNQNVFRQLQQLSHYTVYSL